MCVFPAKLTPSKSSQGQFDRLYCTSIKAHFNFLYNYVDGTFKLKTELVMKAQSSSVVGCRSSGEMVGSARELSVDSFHVCVISFQAEHAFLPSGLELDIPELTMFQV